MFRFFSHYFVFVFLRFVFFRFFSLLFSLFSFRFFSFRFFSFLFVFFPFLSLQVPRCRCCPISKNSIRADCSYLNLTRFPDFTEDVAEINFSRNNLTSISKGTKLPTDVKSLDISYCQLRIIEKGFIRQLQHLEYLDISHNRELSLEVLPNVTFDLQFTNIKEFNCSAMQCSVGYGLTVRLRHVRHLKNTSLVSLFISSNRIETVERGAFAYLPETLENLIAADNRLKVDYNYIESLIVKNIKYVDISYQFKSLDRSLSYFEFQCDDRNSYFIDIEDEKDMVPSQVETQKETMSGTCMTKYTFHHIDAFPLTGVVVHIFICMPPFLETVILSHSSVVSYPLLNGIFSYYRNLKSFIIKDNRKTILRNEIYSNITTHLDFSQNFISEIHPLYFKLTNLTYLNLSNNHLGHFLRQESSTDLLKEQTFLKTLALARNTILDLPYGFLDTFVRLKLLDLSDNELNDITFSFRNLRKLEKLNLSKNRLKIFNQKTMNELDSIATGRHLTISLSKNFIFCSCASLDFLRWMLYHSYESIIFFEDLQTYSCTFQNSTRGNFSELPYIISRLEKECASYVGLIIACVMAATAVLIIVFVGVVYRYRWRIRYMYYMAKRSYRGSVRTQNGNNRKIFIYDAFVSYSSDDREIAFHHFRQNIESQSLKLCFHERDFIPGFDIAENIASAIHDSRKVVCVLSNNFLSSSWCMYEFNMALMERIHRPDGENMLFLVRLKDFDVKKAPLTML